MSGTVLIVDSDYGFATSTQDALEAHGFAVHVVDDAPIDVVRTLRPTVLMLSCETRGFKICSRIRSDDGLRQVRILMTSSELPREALEQHAQSPVRADDYALKPITIDEVVQRLSRLSATAPAVPPPMPRGASAAEPAAAPDGPPPLRSASGGAEPAGPPPLRRQSGSDAPEPPPPSASTSSRSAERSADGWPTDTFDAALRSALTAPASAKTAGRASPEERLSRLREQVKHYQTREKGLKDTWTEVQATGQELARRLTAASETIEAKEQEIASMTADLSSGSERAEQIESEFRNFQEEIERIFQEKDGEEAERAAYLEQLESEHAAATADLGSVREQIDDDKKRIAILQEELAALELEAQKYETLASEREHELSVVRSEYDATGARLEMAESIASERADEVQTLKDKLDKIQLDAEGVQRHLESEWQQKFADRGSEHEVEVEELNRRHADIIESLERTHEVERGNFEQEHSAASGQVASLEESLAEVRAQAAFAEEQANLQARSLQKRLDQTEAARAALDAQVERLEVRNVELEGERADLQSRTEAMRVDLEGQRIRAEEIQLEFNDVSARVETQTSQSTQRIANLEEELDAAQNELFERLAELDHHKKAGSQLDVRTRKLETALEAEKSALENQRGATSAAETALAELQSRTMSAEHDRSLFADRTQELEEQLTRLEEQSRDSKQMLEIERAAKRTLEEQLHQASSQESKLAADKARVAQQVEQARSELAEMESRLEEELISTHELTAMLETERTAREAAEAETAILRTDVRSADTDQQSLRDQISRLQKDRDDERLQRQAAENEIADKAEELMRVQRALTKEEVGRGTIDKQLRAAHDQLSHLERIMAEAQEREKLLARAARTLLQVQGQIPDRLEDAIAFTGGEPDSLNLDEAFDPDYVPATAIFRTANNPLGGHAAHQEVTNPGFAAHEIEPIEEEDDGPFASLIAGGSAQLGAPAALPRSNTEPNGRDGEEDERLVTEIISLTDLES